MKYILISFCGGILFAVFISIMSKDIVQVQNTEQGIFIKYKKNMYELVKIKQ